MPRQAAQTIRKRRVWFVLFGVSRYKSADKAGENQYRRPKIGRMLDPPVIKHTSKQSAHRCHSALAITQQRGGNRRGERRADVGQRQIIRQRAVFEKQRQQRKRRAQSVHQQKVLPRMRITGCWFF